MDGVMEIGFWFLKIQGSGGDGRLATPVAIPHTEVKQSNGDDS